MDRLSAADFRAGGWRDFFGAVQAKGGVWQDHAAELRVVHVFQHAAAVHVGVGHDLGDVAHRGGGDAGAAGGGEDFHLSQCAGPGGDDGVDLGHVGGAVRHGFVFRVAAKVLAAHGAQQVLPMLLGDYVDGHKAVVRLIDVVRRAGQGGLVVAGAPGDVAGAVVGLHRRGHRAVNGFLHRDLDQPAGAGGCSFEQRGHYAGVEVDAAHEVDEGRTGLHRRAVGHPRHAHDAGDRLDGEVHGLVVAVRPRDAVAGAGGVDQRRVGRVQHVPADAQPVHHAGGEILQQHVGLLRHADQQGAAFFRFEVEGDGALVGVEHGDGQGLAVGRAAAQRLAVQGLDLDDFGAGLGHQHGGVRALIDLAEIEHGYSGQRRLGGHLLSSSLSQPAVSPRRRRRQRAWRRRRSSC